MYIQYTVRKLQEASAGAFTQPVALIGFVAAGVVGPFVLLMIGGRQSSNLPWYFWVTILLLLLVVTGVGFLMFTRDSHEGQDISISPDRR
jgi:MFS family permease